MLLEILSVISDLILGYKLSPWTSKTVGLSINSPKYVGKLEVELSGRKVGGEEGYGHVMSIGL